MAFFPNLARIDNVFNLTNVDYNLPYLTTVNGILPNLT